MKKRIRQLRGLLSVVRLVRDPDRLDEVFELADASMSDDDLRSRRPGGRVRGERPARGARALAERPRIGKLDLAALGALPEGTLGRTFAEHMIRNGLDPAAIPSLASPDALSFIRAHLYETHDVWHAVTGFGTDVAGELGLQAFGLAQFRRGSQRSSSPGGLLHGDALALRRSRRANAGDRARMDPREARAEALRRALGRDVEPAHRRRAA